MSNLRELNYDQGRARAARTEAAELRDLYATATCGLEMQYRGVHYGTCGVPQHISVRVAEQYLVWADEYDAIADGIERRIADALVYRPEGVNHCERR